jgi:hypothetical protein
MALFLIGIKAYTTEVLVGLCDLQKYNFIVYIWVSNAMQNKLTYLVKYVLRKASFVLASSMSAYIIVLDAEDEVEELLERGLRLKIPFIQAKIEVSLRDFRRLPPLIQVRKLSFDLRFVGRTSTMLGGGL